MKIYIPTRGRGDKQITLGNLPTALHKDVSLVIDYSERHFYVPGIHMLVCPKNMNHIGKVRQFICDWHDIDKYGPALLMLDDDLVFYKRRTDQPDKFESATDADVKAMVKRMEIAMKSYAHAGILAREGGNRITVPTKENTRLLRALAYDVETMRELKVRFDRVTIMEDFDVALQLLRRGFPSLCLCQWVHNQVGSGTAGGCSIYRTLAKQAEGAHKLHELHPEFVKVVQKQTKTAWQGALRTDVVVQWARAYASSKGA